MQSEASGGWIAAACAPFVILIAAATDLHLHWHEIPSQFLNGHTWATRSFFGVFGPLLTAVMLAAALAIMAWATLHTAPHETLHAGKQQRLVAVGMMLLAYFLALVFAQVALMPISPISPKAAAGATVVFVPVVIGVCIVLVAAAALPSEHGSEPPSSYAAARADPANWTACFYRNPDDPALMVPKRDGTGYTFNIGQPRARTLGVTSVALIVLAFVPMMMLMSHGVK